MKPVIRIIGDIDSSMVLLFSQIIAEYEDDKKIRSSYLMPVELNSGGGVATDALAIIGRMRQSRFKFQVTVFGMAASAASIILYAGDYRSMAKEAWLMVHEDGGRIKGDVATFEREVKHLRRMEDQWNSLSQGYTGIPKKVFEKLNKATTYISADQALAVGIIHSVV